MGFSAFSRFEKIDDISLSAINRTFQLPSQGGQLPSDRWMAGIYLQVEGRLTNPAAGGGGQVPTAFQADAPFSLLDRIQVQGFHRIRKMDELFINVRGADLREMNRLYTLHNPLNVSSINAAALVQDQAFSLAADATNDFRFIVMVPFVPLGMSLREQTGWLLDAPNYDRLRLDIKWSDAASVFTLGSVVPAFTAFGSVTGSPRVRVAGVFAMGGQERFAGQVSGRVWRYFAEATGSLLTTTATGVRLFDLPRGNRLRHCILKTGALAVTTAGNASYLSRSDTIAANIDFMQGTNRSIRKFPDFFGGKEHFAIFNGVQPSAGYMPIDFAMSGALAESLDVRGLIAGATGNTDLFLQSDVLGAANQGALMLFEELRNAPVRVVTRRR